jgi:preprotein translocase subunit SecY
MLRRYRNHYEQSRRTLALRATLTLAVVALYHVGLVAPTPGLALPPDELARLVDTYALVEIHNHMIAGGGLRIGVGVFALGFLPYLQASAVMAFLVAVVPVLKRRSREGIFGARSLKRWTYGLTLPFALLDAFGFVRLLVADTGEPVPGLVLTGAAVLVAGALITLVGVRLIDERGLGPGIAILSASSVMSVFAGAVLYAIPAGLPPAEDLAKLLAVVLCGILVVWAAVILNAVSRRIPLNDVRRANRQSPFASEPPSLPLILDYAGADAIVVAAITVGFLSTVAGLLAPDAAIAVTLQDTQSLLFVLLLVPLMALFSLIYTAHNLDVWEVAEMLVRQGRFISGVRPGLKTAEYLDSVLLKLTVVGIVIKSALLLAIWAGLRMTGLDGDPVTLFSTLLVTVPLANTLLSEIRSWWIMGVYDGLLRKSKVRGRGAVSGEKNLHVARAVPPRAARSPY